MSVSAVYLPHVMYCRFTRARPGVEDGKTEEEDVLPYLHGNPLGDGTSTVPYIYCLSQKELKKHLVQLYNLKVTMRWPRKAKMMDETRGRDQPRTKPTYEEYICQGYAGVLRKFEDSKRYIVFHPSDYIVEIVDTDSGRMLYENDNLREADLGIPAVDLQKVTDYFYDPKHREEQIRVNDMMMEIITPRYIDLETDYFDVAEIARRRRVPVDTVLQSVCRLVKRIVVDKTSGCWVSPRKGDYMKTFWLSKGGVTFKQMFHLPQELRNGDPTVVKNRHILHATICEVTLGRRHFECCRPQHLRLGTSRENSVHIKVRKSIDQLFDLTYAEMRELSFHILKLSEIVQRQEHIMTPHELGVFQRRKGNKTIECEDLGSGKRWTSVCGDPDAGDVHSEREELQARGYGLEENVFDDGPPTDHGDEYDYEEQPDGFASEEDEGDDSVRRRPQRDGREDIDNDSDVDGEDEKYPKKNAYDNIGVDGMMFKHEEKLRRAYAKQLN